MLLFGAIALQNACAQKSFSRAFLGVGTRGFYGFASLRDGEFLQKNTLINLEAAYPMQAQQVVVGSSQKHHILWFFGV
jgi:hypothetical protein